MLNSGAKATQLILQLMLPMQLFFGTEVLSQDTVVVGMIQSWGLSPELGKLSPLKPGSHNQELFFWLLTIKAGTWYLLLRKPFNSLKQRSSFATSSNSLQNRTQTFSSGWRVIMGLGMHYYTSHYSLGVKIDCAFCLINWEVRAKQISDDDYRSSQAAMGSINLQPPSIQYQINFKLETVSSQGNI